MQILITAHAEQPAGELLARDVRLLRAVFAQSGIGADICATTGRILVVNAACAAMFGYGICTAMDTRSGAESTAR